jgi:hypothetical protein
MLLKFETSVYVQVFLAMEDLGKDAEEVNDYIYDHDCRVLA